MMPNVTGAFLRLDVAELEVYPVEHGFLPTEVTLRGCL